MKVTMYELLGMVKDGKAPKKIKINEDILNLRIGKGTSYEFGTSGGMLSFDYYIENNKLDTIVEIIGEKEDKKIEKLKPFQYLGNENNQSVINENFNRYFKEINNKINEMIDYIMEDK